MIFLSGKQLDQWKKNEKLIKVNFKVKKLTKKY